jgi:membrane protease YdiL (CAAX protease family)
MYNNLKIRSPWAQMALFLGAFGATFFFFAIALLLIKGGNAAQAPDLGNPQVLAGQKFMQAAWTIILFGLPSLVYALASFREKPLRELGFRPATLTSFYLLAIVLLAVATPLEGWLGMLNRRIPLPGSLVDLERTTDKQVMAYLKVRSPLDIVINLLIMAVLPAIFEELCFRGVVQRILIQAFGHPWGGIIVAAALFSAFHMQFQGFLPRMMLGVLLGVAYWYSGSLWPSIFAHMFYNGIQVVIASYYPKMVDDNPSVPALLGAGSLVLVVGLVGLMRRQSTVTYDKVYGLRTDDLFEFEDKGNS